LLDPDLTLVDLDFEASLDPDSTQVEAFLRCDEVEFLRFGCPGARMSAKAEAVAELRLTSSLGMKSYWPERIASDVDSKILWDFS